jgi:PPOX class probable F420-dependent enzyme
VSDPAANLERASRYVSLGTYRRSGVPVDTPIWFAALDGHLVMFTNGRSGKVKRLRNGSRARVAVCDLRGKLQGPWHEARAWLVDDAARHSQALRALAQRYGWQFRLLKLGASLSGRKREWAVIEVELDPS